MDKKLCSKCNKELSDKVCRECSKHLCDDCDIHYYDEEYPQLLCAECRDSWYEYEIMMGRILS